MQTVLSEESSWRSSILSDEVFPCRICLDNTVTVMSNPLINPCTCSGSMGNVNLNCLRKWVRQKVKVTMKRGITIIKWQSLYCELCKTPYPYAIYFYDDIYELIRIHPVKAPYAVFEGTQNGHTVLYAVSFSEKPYIKIGNSIEADLFIDDKTISVRHSILTLNNDGLKIEDDNSRFGTLKKLNEPLILKENYTASIQITNILCQFTLKRKRGFLSCFRGKQNNIKYTNTENEINNISFTSCFPDNGRHSLLIVNKQKYRKMIKREEMDKEDKSNFDFDEGPLCLNSISLYAKFQKTLKSIKYKDGAKYLYNCEMRIPTGDTADYIIGE